MPSQWDNGGQGGPWGRGAKPGSEIDKMVRQGQDRLKQIMPSGSPRGTIILAILALVGLGARDAKLLQHCNAALPRRSPVPNERMTSPLGSAVYPGQENTMEIAFAIALPAFIAGVFYLALWLQWQPG